MRVPRWETCAALVYFGGKAQIRRRVHQRVMLHWHLVFWNDFGSFAEDFGMVNGRYFAKASEVFVLKTPHDVVGKHTILEGV